MKRKILTIFLVAFALIAIALAVALLVPSPSAGPVTRTIPSPNGYETLLDAARQIVGNPEGYAQMTQDELRIFVAENTNALSAVRIALDQESLVPWEATAQYQSNHIGELSQFKILARTLTAEGRLAELDGRWQDAAGSYLTMIEMSGLISRGGMVIDALVAVATESMGLNELRVLTGSITNPTVCRAVCDKLVELDRDRPHWSDAVAVEKEWQRQAYSGVHYRVATFVMRKTIRASAQRTEEKYLAAQKKLREVLLESAARAYELEQGKRPASATVLVPGYLASLPIDPVTGQELGLPP